MQYKSLEPSPSSLVESLRDIGYSMETALADVIDNSITAEASRIDISFSWNLAKPWLAIQDNGYGMAEAELLYAMRLGSDNPLNERNENDLGRFGLGLKTASFSQCRQVTVISKKDNAMSAMEWDLDQITDSPTDGWKIKILSNEDLENISEINSLLEGLAKQSTGTLVVWRKLDRLDSFDSLAIREKKLNALIDSSRNHIELTFHRFLNAGAGKKSIKMYINGDQLIGNDPFNSSHLATLELPKQPIYVDSKEITVQPYILPHYTKVSAQEYDKFAGEGGYLHNQGFYVYRNKRLIIKSTWFRLMPKDELTKLIRVRVDIPNSLDHIWKIDVKKSNANPPETVRKGLKQIISEVEYSGKRVFKQKGYQLKSKVLEPVWNRNIASGKVTYEISKSHPLIDTFKTKLDDESQRDFLNILKSIESSFPSDLYFNDFANSPESVEKPLISEKELTNIINVFLPVYLPTSSSTELLFQKLVKIDPMASAPKLTQKILNEMELTL
ncbi:ATP-binding protein [Psychromonas arctica]|uniref:ATP-binding protein n=1 Tax=Psychromonas arctica TaxID=168275 RepID=UPI002FD2B26B